MELLLGSEMLVHSRPNSDGHCGAARPDVELMERGRRCILTDKLTDYGTENGRLSRITVDYFPSSEACGNFRGLPVWPYGSEGSSAFLLSSVEPR